MSAVAIRAVLHFQSIFRVVLALLVFAMKRRPAGANSETRKSGILAKVVSKCPLKFSVHWMTNLPITHI